MFVFVYLFVCLLNVMKPGISVPLERNNYVKQGKDKKKIRNFVSVYVVKIFVLFNRKNGSSINVFSVYLRPFK